MTVTAVDTTCGRFTVHRWGAGAAVILLHPLALAGGIWNSVAAALATEFQVIALDLRGHGSSSWDGAPFTIDRMATDVAEVMDALDLSSAALVGMSMGGSVAVTFAGRYPDRVSSLVLADTTAWYGEQAIRTWSERADRARHVPRVEQVPFQVDRWFSTEFQARHPDEVQRVVRIFLATNGKAHAAASIAMGRLDARPLLPAVRASTLVLVGERDHATPPAMAEQLAEGIAGASLLVLPALRHLSLVERPELARLVGEHLHGRSGSGRPPVSRRCACSTDERDVPVSEVR